MGLKELIEKTEKVQPIAEANGIPVYTFEQQRDLAQVDKLMNVDMGLLTFNPDGSVAETPTKYVAINLEHYYINRFKRVGKSLYIVTDYRAISEQSSGRVYLKQIPAFVISRNKDGDLYLEKTVTVSDDEFIADFTHILNREAMKTVLPLLVSGQGVTSEDLSI